MTYLPFRHPCQVENSINLPNLASAVPSKRCDSMVRAPEILKDFNNFQVKVHSVPTGAMFFLTGCRKITVVILDSTLYMYVISIQI